jgi:hypothetical protein
MTLRKRALGMSLGILWGLSVFLTTIWAIAGGHGATLAQLQAYYFGYSVTYLGAFIGLIWGFVHGFIAGVLIAWLYDLFCKAFYRSGSA